MPDAIRPALGIAAQERDNFFDTPRATAPQCALTAAGRGAARAQLAA
jgi:hypothetical protein